jgi:hypothetical protein
MALMFCVENKRLLYYAVSFLYIVTAGINAKRFTWVWAANFIDGKEPPLT